MIFQCVFVALQDSIIHQRELLWVVPESLQVILDIDEATGNANNTNIEWVSPSLTPFHP